MKPSHYFTRTLQSFRNNLLLFVLAIASLTSCDYSDVEIVEVGEFNLHEISGSGAKLKASLRIHNPNDYKIKVKSTDADIFINGAMAGEADLVNEIVIPANFNDYLETEIEAKFAKGSVMMLPIALQVSMGKPIEVKVVGTIKARSGLISKKVDFEFEDKAFQK